MNTPVDRVKGKVRQSVRKRSKYIVVAAVFVFLLCNSFYFEDLRNKRAAEAGNMFDVEQYAKDFWDKLGNKIETAGDAGQLLASLRLDMHKAIEEYSTKTRDVTSTHFFLLQGQGKIVSGGEDGVLISLTEGGSAPEVLIATDLIFGNAVRDASGLVDSDDFEDSMDYNKVSEHINDIVMNEVIACFRDKAREGATVRFIGAAEIFEDDPKINPLRIVPIKLEFK